LTIVTEASGTTAPVSSTTVPRMSPVVCCAFAVIAARENNSPRPRKILRKIPLVICCLLNLAPLWGTHISSSLDERILGVPSEKRQVRYGNFIGFFGVNTRRYPEITGLLPKEIVLDNNHSGYVAYPRNRNTVS